ncbi:unnamed protein product [Soboliphyme baturini]|uniref:Guanylate cyclase domain-containing protein n=1 Tax=Soboliphyme baturini TaxID=241478 RepID=A0A183IKH4_9BILA|nr:unnamed protein product [Soboliphyme baturini]
MNVALSVELPGLRFAKCHVTFVLTCASIQKFWRVGGTLGVHCEFTKGGSAAGLPTKTIVGIVLGLITAIGMVVVTLIMLRYVRRSQMLKGKYNPSKEELKCTGTTVFLGGSCGASTWRQDIAIPYLQRLGISFFNPVRDQACLCSKRGAADATEPASDEVDRLRTLNFIYYVLRQQQIPTCVTISEALRLIELIICRQKTFLQVVMSLSWLKIYIELYAQVGRFDVIPKVKSYKLKFFLLLLELTILSMVVVRFPSIYSVVGAALFIIVYLLIPAAQFFLQFYDKYLRKAAHDLYIGGDADQVEKMFKLIHNYSQGSFEKRFEVVASSRCIFFVLSCTESFLADFVEVAYYIGSGFRVIAHVDSPPAGRVRNRFLILVWKHTKNIDSWKMFGDFDPICIVCSIYFLLSKTTMRDASVAGCENLSSCYHRAVLYLKDMTLTCNAVVLEDAVLAIKVVLEEFAVVFENDVRMQHLGSAVVGRMAKKFHGALLRTLNLS